ncbi:MAG: glutamate-5-semialdehyde dehydrogenase [Candidatus Kerfeldbacteria bacterium]|nr:glutamate-5-semialdehyde dehydrogenase [Candidatus Kerfeldbacteria bacterium]
MNLITQLKQAKQASQLLVSLSAKQKNDVLKKLAATLRRETKTILVANAKDLAAVPAGYAMTDRLTLTTERVEHIAHSIEAVAKLPDPIGTLLERSTRPSGLQIERRRVPLGVIGAIYEARPNVTTEIFSLAFKTGNAVILKGGRDAYYSSGKLVALIQAVLTSCKLPKALCTLLDAHDRSALKQLVTAHGLVDVIIPRGGKGLIQFVREHAQVPVIETGVGVCHTYVERTANIKLAAAVVFNAKTRRCTVCNALDTIVIDQAALPTHLPAIAKQLAHAEVVIHADAAAYRLLQKQYPKHLLLHSRPQDYSHEWVSLQLSIKTVAHYEAAVQFVQQHTSGHSEAILTSNKRLAGDFTHRIDSAVVYVNTPTTFTDGFEFGLGAEVGISTQKLHARGPMGLTALTTYKWLVRSNGAIRKP